RTTRCSHYIDCARCDRYLDAANHTRTSTNGLSGRGSLSGNAPQRTACRRPPDCRPPAPVPAFPRLRPHRHRRHTPPRLKGTVLQANDTNAKPTQTMNDITSHPDPIHDENHLIAERRAKLAKLRERQIAYPNDFSPAHRAQELHQAYGEHDKQ